MKKDLLESIGLFATITGVAGVFLVGLIIAIAMSLRSGTRDLTTSWNQDGNAAQASVAPEFVGHTMYDSSYEYDIENPWDQIDFMRRLAR